MKSRFYIAAAASLAMVLACNQIKPVPTEPVNPPMLGWSTWNAFATDINDSIIRAQADVMAESGLKDAGYTYINIDDGLFGPRDSEGRMTALAPKFPDGLRVIADYIHSKGLKAGIYSDAGENTCAGYIGGGLYGHDDQDYQTYFNDWDYDFIKIDYCGGSSLGLDVTARYKEIKHGIDSVSTKPIKINICRWDYPGTWAPEVGDSWRISYDIRPRWSSIKGIIGLNLYLSAYAGGGHYNDMDMMVVGYKDKPCPFGNYGEEDLEISFQEEEAHFGMWCIMSSPIILGCDLAYMPAEVLELVTNPELLAVNQDPLGLQANVVWHEGKGYVLAKDIEQLRGGTRAVALYNPSGEDITVSAPLEALELGGNVTVRDLNMRSDMIGVLKDSISMFLPAHSAEIFKVTGTKRLEPTIYEGEWGFIPAFSRVDPGNGDYTEQEGASGQVVASGLGKSPENCLIWKNVWSDKGGKYEMNLVCFVDGQDKVDLDVNGEVQTIDLAGAAAGRNEYKVAIKLKKGYNTVKLSNDAAPMPAIDCFTLARTK